VKEKSNHLLVFLALAVICAALASTGCGIKAKTNPGSAPEASLRQLIKAGYDLAAVINTGEKELESVYQSRLIDADEARSAGMWIERARNTDQRFISRLQSVTSADSSNKAQIVAWVKEAAGELRDFSQSGLAVKNQKAKDRLSVVFSGVDLIMNTVNSIVIAIPDPAPAAHASFSKGHKNQYVEVQFGRTGSSTAHQPGCGQLYRHFRVGSPSEAEVRTDGRTAGGQSHGDERGYRAEAPGVSGDSSGRLILIESCCRTFPASE